MAAAVTSISAARVASASIAQPPLYLTGPPTSVTIPPSSSTRQRKDWPCRSPMNQMPSASQRTSADDGSLV